MVICSICDRRHVRFVKIVLYSQSLDARWRVKKLLDVCCCSDVSDDVVLHVVRLMLRLSSSSAAIRSTTDALLLVSA